VQLDDGIVASVLCAREFHALRQQFHVHAADLALAFQPEKLGTGEIFSKFSDVRSAAAPAVRCVRSTRRLVAALTLCLATGVPLVCQGKSSSFFCRSADGRFILKTIDQREAASLVSFLPHYVAHAK
jgi:hypothetical protein